MPKKRNVNGFKAFLCTNALDFMPSTSSELTRFCVSYHLQMNGNRGYLHPSRELAQLWCKH